MDQIRKVSEHNKPKAWKNGMDGKNTFLKKFLFVFVHFRVSFQCKLFLFDLTTKICNYKVPMAQI